MPDEVIQIGQGSLLIYIVQGQRPSRILARRARIATGGVTGEIDVIFAAGKGDDAPVRRIELAGWRLRLTQAVHQDCVMTHSVERIGITIGRTSTAVIQHLPVSMQLERPVGIK